MFDEPDNVVGLFPGKGTEVLEVEDRLAWEVSCRELADGWTVDERHVLPDDLEGIPVGPYLAAVVSSVDPSKLNGYDAVRLMKAQARLSSHHEAGKYRAVSEIAFCPPSDPDSGVERSSSEIEYAEVEVAAGLTLTRHASTDLLNRAVSLCDRLVRVWEVFSAGLIDPARVRVFDLQLGHLPHVTVDTVLDRILDEAADLTTGQLSARLGRLVLEVDPDGSAGSYQEGLAERKVAVYSNPDHTATFGVYSASPDRVSAARDHVETLARGLKTGDEPRTLDQLRADVALDLLTGRIMGESAGRVNITVSAETLARLDDQPCDLDGFGPVFAEIARKTVYENVDGEWTFTVTDQGRPVATGTVRRRPTASQQRHVRSEYPNCVFPGCRMPAHSCDLDHRRPVSQGGPTHNDNLGPLCRYHHTTRHHTPWLLERKPNGDHEWTSPLGHRYLRKRGPPDLCSPIGGH